MSARWSWITGIATLGALILSLVFFGATQTVSVRDVLAAVIGVVIGTMLSAFVATFIFHKDGRRAEHAAAGAIANRKASLLEALPTRKEAIRSLHEQEAQTQIDIATADGNQKSLMISAREHAEQGFSDMAVEALASAKTWAIVKADQERRYPDVLRERERLEATSDEDYLVEQKYFRGLD